MNRVAVDEAGVPGSSLNDDAWLGLVRFAADDPPLGRIGPYELLGQAGRGGQGLVYRARQPNTGREVALKRMSAGVFATPEMRQRFEREIEAAAALDHPHIVTLYGGEVLDDQLVLVMQWVDGVPFDAWARPAEGRPRPVREVLQAFERVCEAIHHAHQRGVIHRDLKPANIMVDREGQPHVLDFGLAKLLTADDSGAASLTHTGFVGTPAYAAPEQLRGSPANVDVRTDVYSLGALLYHALTGRFVVDPLLPLAELIERAGRDAIRAPSSLDGRLDRDVDAILLKAVAGDKELRYGSVAELGADVRRLLNGQPVLAHPPSATYLFRKLIRRHALAAGVTLAVALALIAATVISMTLYVQARTERARADEEAERARIALASETSARERMQQESATVVSINEFLSSMLDFAGESGQVSGGPLTVREMLNRAGERLEGGREALDPGVEASLRMTIANSFRKLGLETAAASHYTRALGLRKSLFGEESLPVAENLDALGRCYRMLGRLEEAERLIEAAWNIRVRVLPADDGYFAPAANSLGLIKKALEKWDEAERWYLDSLRRYRLMSGPYAKYAAENVPVVLMNLAHIELLQDRPIEAEAHLREAVALGRDVHGDAPQLNRLIAMEFLADALRRQGDPTGEAESLFCATVAQMRSLVGDPHIRVARALARHAAFLRDQQRFDEAAAIQDEAARAMEQLEHWEDAIGSLGALAELLRSGARNDEGLETCNRALELARSQGVAAVAILAAPMSTRAAILTDLGCFEAAEAQWLELRTMLEAADDSLLPQLASAQAGLAHTYERWHAVEPQRGLDRKATELRAAAGRN